MSGTAFAQVLGIAAAPILSRLYHPRDFGAYAIYTTVLMISAPLISARYELAIVPAETDDEAFGLLLISFATTILLSGVVLFGFAQRPLLARVGLEPVAEYAGFIALGVAISGIYQALRQFSIRGRHFRDIATSQVLQSSGVSVVQVSYALAKRSGPLGLIGGQIVGLVISTFVLGRGLRKAFAAWRIHYAGSGGLLTLRRLARSYRSYPTFLPWGGLVDALAQKLPVLMLSVFYGPTFLGLYAVADRLLKTPATLVGQSAAQVLFQKMTEPRTKARMPWLITMWALGMTVASVLPFGLFFFFGRPLFALVLGQSWALAGTIAAALIPVYWGALVVSPISTLLIIANRQALLLLLQILFLASGFASLWLGHRFLYSGVQTILLYSISQFCVYIVYFLALLSTSGKIARTQTELAGVCVA